MVRLLSEALKTTEPLTGNAPIMIRSQIPVLAWAKLCPEEASGVTLNQKVPCGSGTS